MITTKILSAILHQWFNLRELAGKRSLVIQWFVRVHYEFWANIISFLCFNWQDVTDDHDTHLLARYRRQTEPSKYQQQNITLGTAHKHFGGWNKKKIVKILCLPLSDLWNSPPPPLNMKLWSNPIEKDVNSLNFTGKFLPEVGGVRIAEFNLATPRKCNS